MTIPQLHQRRQELIAWATSCLAAADWHGLRDAASDLEVIAARLDEWDKVPSVYRQRADLYEPTIRDMIKYAHAGVEAKLGRSIYSTETDALLGYEFCQCRHCSEARNALAIGNAKYL